MSSLRSILGYRTYFRRFNGERGGVGPSEVKQKQRERERDRAGREKRGRVKQRWIVVRTQFLLPLGFIETKSTLPLIRHRK